MKTVSFICVSITAPEVKKSDCLSRQVFRIRVMNVWLIFH